MIVAPFSINKDRYNHMEFSLPFLEAGIGLLARRDVDHLSHNFLTPFTATMWLALLASILVGESGTLRCPRGRFSGEPFAELRSLWA